MSVIDRTPKRLKFGAREYQTRLSARGQVLRRVNDGLKVAKMSVQEIESAVQQLPPDELEAFTKWFEQFIATAWDRRFEADAAAGRLDTLGDEALAEFRAGRTTPL